MGKKKLARRGPAPRGMARWTPPLQPVPLRVAPLQSVAADVEVPPPEIPPQPTEMPPNPGFTVDESSFSRVSNPLIFPFQSTLFGEGLHPETLVREAESAMADSRAIAEESEKEPEVGDRGLRNNEGSSTSKAAGEEGDVGTEGSNSEKGQDVVREVLKAIRLMGVDVDTDSVSAQRKRELVELRGRVIPGVVNVNPVRETDQKEEKTEVRYERKRSSSRISSSWGFGKKVQKEGSHLDSPLIIEEDDTTEAEVVVSREEIIQSRKEQEKEIPEREAAGEETPDAPMADPEEPKSLDGEEVGSDQATEEAYIPEEPEQDSGETTSDSDRYEAERKRKGKQPASIKKKRESRPASRTVVIREYLQVSDDEEDEWLASGSDSDEPTSLIGSEEEEAQRQELERIKVLLNANTERSMKKFKDMKQQKEFQDRERAVSKSKLHREVHYPSLDLLTARRNFTVFISKLGCAWLVNLQIEPVPHLLACEFFTSFEFQTTIDLDIESISFRMFGREFRMSLTEWCVRLGIVSMEEALEAEFRGLEIGLPGKHFEFDIEAAWRLISIRGAGPYKHGKPLAHFIANPSVRLTNNFLAYNLLGQHTCFTRISVNEMYFMWCMLNGRGINLGFWLAIQCHQISSHLTRHMSLCHVIGALLFYSFDITRTPQSPRWNVVDRSEPFDLKCFCRTLIAIRLEEGPRFYRPGEIFPQARGTTVGGEQAEQGREGRLEELEQQQGQLIREVWSQRGLLEEMKEMMGQMLMELKQMNKRKEDRAAEDAEKNEQDGSEGSDHETTSTRTRKRRQSSTSSPRSSKRGR